MGIARDVFEILDTNFSELSDSLMKRFDGYDSAPGSISRKAADGTLQFPVIISRSIGFENAQRVVKAAEAKAANFAEIVMTMNPEWDTGKNTGGADYIRQFHSNIDTEDDTFGQAMHFINKESYNTMSLLYSADSYDYKALKEELKEFGADWREGKLNDVAPAKYVKDNQFVIPLKGSKIQELMKQKLKAVKEARENDDSSLSFEDKERIRHGYRLKQIGAQGDESRKTEKLKNKFQKERDDEARKAKADEIKAQNEFQLDRDDAQYQNQLELQRMRQDYDMEKQAAQNEYNAQQKELDREFQEWIQNHHDASQKERDKMERQFREKQSKLERDFKEKQSDLDRNFRREEARKERKFREKMAARPDRVAMQDILMNNEVKKSNELQPTLLHIRVIAKEEKMYTDFVIGVKATMHPINSEEMISELVEACRFHSEVFRFIRWTTGEINFLGDFLLNMRDSKKAVARQSSGGSPWWNRLRKMSVIAKFKKATFMKKRILPNATIVVSQQEVDYVKNTYGFDLLNPHFVEEIMDKFFLLCFAIVDDSLEVVHFKYDGQKSYQTVSFAGLEKENSNAARSFRDILKAVQRV